MKQSTAKSAKFLVATALTLFSNAGDSAWAMDCEGSFVTQTRTSRLRETMQNFWPGRATRSRDQVVPVTPAIATIEQFKSALATDTTPLKTAIRNAGENPALESFLSGNLLNLYQMMGRDGKELLDLIRLSGTPVTEKLVAGYRGESILQSDAPEKTVATVVRLNNATFNPETSVSEIARELNLNPQYVTLRDGLLMVEERSGSTSGMGIHDPGVYHPGLTEIRAGKIPGFSVAPLIHDNYLSQGSVWGGRYSETTISAVVPMDAAKFHAARSNLGTQLVELNLQVLAAGRITDPSLNRWLDQVSKYTLQSVPWYKATTSGNAVENLALRTYSGQSAELRSAIARHLYIRRVLNFKPTETFEHKSTSDARFHLDGSIAENISQRGKLVNTVSHFPKDMPFVRTGLGNNTFEIFGHLRASESPATEMTADNVQAYIRKNVPELFRGNNQVEIKDVVVTSEGQFSANVVVKLPTSLLRRFLGRGAN